MPQSIKKIKKGLSQPHAVGYIQKKTKVKVFNAVATSTLLYEAGTWTRKESETKRLESVHYRVARRMLEVKQTDHYARQRPMRA